MEKFMNQISKLLSSDYSLVRKQIFVLYVQTRNKSIKQYLDYTKVPKLYENDLQEQAVKGSGPGGSAVNSSYNCVVLKHIPSGLVVKCHLSRMLDENRKTARELLITKLDNFYNGKDSIENQTKTLLQEKSRKKEYKQRKLTEKKAAYKKLFEKSHEIVEE
ncbi:mitochondrial translation release factor in rescue [Prorops nasuta]|uniref:mitochondrial translation release factor in rescue n=1 Tax=Prorops nasuta TaxID=863751 RepID=UPI0034CF653C